MCVCGCVGVCVCVCVRPPPPRRLIFGPVKGDFSRIRNVTDSDCMTHGGGKDGSICEFGGWVVLKCMYGGFIVHTYILIAS